MKKIILSLMLTISSSSLLSVVKETKLITKQDIEAFSYGLVKFAESTNYPSEDETAKQIPTISGMSQYNRKFFAIIIKAQNNIPVSLSSELYFEFESEEDIAIIAQELDKEENNIVTLNIIWFYKDLENYEYDFNCDFNDALYIQ